MTQRIQVSKQILAWPKVYVTSQVIDILVYQVKPNIFLKKRVNFFFKRPPPPPQNPSHFTHNEEPEKEINHSRL